METPKVAYWDEVASEQKTRDMTPAEVAQWEIDQAAAAMPVIPDRVSMRQAKLALLGAGLLSSVDDYINNLPEPARTAALIEWNSAYCERNNSLVKALPAAMGWTIEQVDALFIAAAAIE